MIRLALGLLLVHPRLGWDRPDDAHAVWQKLERMPGFNADLRRAEADLAAGHGVPFRDGAAGFGEAGW